MYQEQDNGHSDSSLSFNYSVSSQVHKPWKKFKGKKRPQEEGPSKKGQEAKRRPCQDDYDARISNYSEGEATSETIVKTAQSTLNFPVLNQSQGEVPSTSNNSSGATPKTF